MDKSLMHEDGSVTYALRVDAVVTDEHLQPLGLGALLRAHKHRREAKNKKRREQKTSHKGIRKIGSEKFFSPHARGIDDPIKRIFAVLEHEGVTFKNHLCTRAGVTASDVDDARTDGVIVRTWKKYSNGSGALAYCLPCQITEQQREMFTC